MEGRRRKTRLKPLSASTSLVSSPSTASQTFSLFTSSSSTTVSSSPQSTTQISSSSTPSNSSIITSMISTSLSPSTSKQHWPTLLLSPSSSSLTSKLSPLQLTISSSSSSSPSIATTFFQKLILHKLPTAINNFNEFFINKKQCNHNNNDYCNNNNYLIKRQIDNNKNNQINYNNKNNYNLLSTLKFLSSIHFLLLFLSLINIIPLLCYAQESDFALRPFSASLPHHHHHHHHHPQHQHQLLPQQSQLINSRRQDGFIAPLINDDSGVGLNDNGRHHPSPITSSSISGAASLNDEPDFGILTAPVPRGSSSNPRPSFQRIRLTNPQNAPNQKVQQPQIPPIRSNNEPKLNVGSPFVLPEEFVPVSLTESPLPNFRVAGPAIRLPPTPAPLPPPPPPPLPIQPVSISSPAQPQRQSFRRIKPSSGNAWKTTKPKPPPTAPPSIIIEPSQVRPVSGRLPISSNIAIITPNDKLTGRGPITGAQDEDLLHKPNALDNEDDPEIGNSFYGNRVSPSDTNDDNGILAIESLSRNTNQFEPARTRSNAATPSPSAAPKQTNVIPTPTIPLTYYTTFTYYTTVVRGPHTAMLSREQVSSSTQLKPIDRNIVTAIEFSDGYIQPSATKTMLGTKLKGATTTIYDVASRVQVFNEDLYKVIFATNTKSIPKPTTTKMNVQILSSTPSSSLSFVSKSSLSSHIAPTRVQISPILLESTKIMSRHPTVHSQQPQQQQNNNKPVKVKFDQLQKQLKKQLSLLTYYYTLIDGTKTQYSTRTEESSTNYNGDLQTLISSIAPTIDSYGLLKIIQPNSVVPLGSRSNGESTTIVNLALNNYIQFSRIKDAQIDISPESSIAPHSIIKPTRAQTPMVSSSIDLRESEVSIDTPKLPSTNAYLDSSTPTPSLLSTPSIIEPSVTTQTTPTRSRTSSPRRPGVRIKLKPSRSKIVNQFSRIHSTQESFENQRLPPSIYEETTSYMLTPKVVDQTPVLSTIEPVEESTTPSSRKKVAFTLRRPGSSGVNRFFSRRPSSNMFNAITPSSSISPSFDFETTSSPSLESTSSTPVVESIMTSSTSLPTLSSISSHEMSTPSLYSSIPTSSSSQSIITSTPSLSEPMESSLYTTIYVEPSPSPSPVWEPSSFSSSILSPEEISSLSLSSSLVPTPTVSRINKSRLVVLTRLAGAVNKWSPMYNNRIKISSRRLIKPTQPMTSLIIDSTGMYPSSSFETVILETTTRTIPFILGPTPTYLVEEVTNTRILDSMEDDFTPSIDDITRIIPNSDSSSSAQITPTLESSSVEEPAKTYIVVETSDTLTTSTLYSTYTYFATLFNGTQTSITPLEEIKTEYLTLREPVLITKTIMPSAQFTPTNVIQSSQMPAASTISIGSSIDSIDDTDDMNRLVTETYSTQTTLTHFITLFSGSHTILSSIEEISPTVMTRTKYVTPFTLLSTSTDSQINVMINSNTIIPTTSSSYQDQPSSTGLYEVDTTTASNDLVIADGLPTDRPSPSPILTSTTSGSVSYETGPLDQDFIMVNNQENDQKPVPNRTLNEQQQPTVIKPGSVIELNDLLDGVQDAGPIGETIKDIVKDIFIKDGDDNGDTTTTTSSPPIGDEQPETTILPSISSTTAKATPSLNRYPTYLSPPSQKSSKYYDSSRDNDVIFSTQSDGNKPTLSTRYVTSIEKSIRTLTLTSTKVYYTRDSPLTITSVLTTTLPPITYVSTIIGSKTILGTYNSITPTKTMMDSSTSSTMLHSISNMQPSIVSSSSSTPSSTLTTVTSTAASPTRPRLHRPKLANEMINKAKVASILNSGSKTTSTTNKPNVSGVNTQQPNLVRNNHTTNMTISVDHLQLCDPACNVTNKEYCRESDIPNLYTCECRPGYVRRPSDNLCQEIKNYLVTVRVSKTAESEVASSSSSSSTDGEIQKYNRVARRQVGKADGIAGLQVLSVEHTPRSKSALVNLTIQIDHQSNNVHDELSKKLEPLGRVEKVIDFDECSSSIHNDCSPRARCINEPGTYSCQCLDPFIDLDRSLPGRLCVAEIKSCDYCYNRGDCWRNNSDIVCRCHPLFIGRRCEINGLLLAILVPILAILVIIAIICFFYCSRKLRKRNRRFKNLAAYGPVAVIGGTLDRKAMLETSSESSDQQQQQQQQQHHHHHHHHHQLRSSQYLSESNPASARGSMARRNHHHHNHTSTLRRESEPSLDRSLASYSATGSHYNSLPHQIVIPRARPTYALHPGQVYMW